jgi:hypothetical protein
MSFLEGNRVERALRGHEEALLARLLLQVSQSLLANTVERGSNQKVPLVRAYTVRRFAQGC